MLLEREPDSASLVLAWIFVAGHLLHGAVQILTAHVRLRGLVFMLNLVAVPGLWIVAAWPDLLA